MQHVINIVTMMLMFLNDMIVYYHCSNVLSEFEIDLNRDMYERHIRISFVLQPELRRDYPLNLSISFSGGKETNKDSLSNGE